MQNSLKLGFGDPPTIVYVYVKADGGEEGGSYLWYHLDHAKNRVPIQKRALTGYIRNLRVKDSVYKNKPQKKLDVLIESDNTYIVRTGFGTVYARGFLLAASLVQDFNSPVTLTVTPGTDNSVVFCGLYDANSKQQYYRKWDNQVEVTDLFAAIHSKIANKLAFGHESEESDEDSDRSFAPQAQPQKNNQLSNQPTTNNPPTNVQIIDILRNIRMLTMVGTNDESDAKLALRNFFVHNYGVNFETVYPTELQIEAAVKYMLHRWYEKAINGSEDMESLWTGLQNMMIANDIRPHQYLQGMKLYQEKLLYSQQGSDW